MSDAAEPLSPELTATLTEFARACKAAARAVALYPAAHPAIAATLARLSETSAAATANGPLAIQVRPGGLLVDGAAPARADAAIGELSQLLHQHLIGSFILNGGTDEQTWRSLLLLLARTPEENRADGGIGRLWTRSGGSSIELREVDYAEVLREREGEAAVIDEVIAACLKGTPRLELDEATLRALVEIVKDPEKLRQFIARLEEAAGSDKEAQASAFLKLLKGLAEYVAHTQPDQLEGILKTMADGAGRLSADAMASLLAQRMNAEAHAGSLNVVGAVVDRISDPAIAGFVAESVIEDRGATERLAEAFGTLVPEMDRKRQLLAAAEEQVAQSPFGQEESFEELWGRVEHMLTTYSDQSYVSEDYARELSGSRGRAVEVEKTSDDPPERIAAWTATINDAAVRDLDLQLLTDMLAVEEDPARWRDVAEGVVAHLDDLTRVGLIDAAWRLAELVASGVGRPGAPHAGQAGPVIDRLARGAFLRTVAQHLRTADDAEYDRFRQLTHLLGPPVIGPLTEILATEQDPRARRRIREVLVRFGAHGRQAVEGLLSSSSWEVRRTAAYLLNEFGATENLQALEPLLADREPRVQREALRAVLISSSEGAFELVLRALQGPSEGRDRLASELMTLKDERSAPLFSYLLPRIDRRALRPLFLFAIETLGSIGGTDAVEALKYALYQGDGWSPLRTRAHRLAAADALRRIGSDAARAVLAEAARVGPRSLRGIARAELRGRS